MSSAFVGLFFVISPKTLAVDFFEQDVTLQKQGASLISDVIVDRKAFNAVVVKPEKAVDNLMVNFGNGWEKVESIDDDGGPDRLMVMAPTHRIQFRLDGPGTNDTLNLKTTLFYYEEGGVGGAPAELQASSELTARTYKVISRTEWGADEELRVWNPDKTTVKDGGENEKPSVDPCADIAKTYASDFKITATKEYNDDRMMYAFLKQYAGQPGKTGTATVNQICPVRLEQFFRMNCSLI